MSLNLLLRNLKLEDYEFEVSVEYIVDSNNLLHVRSFQKEKKITLEIIQ